MTTTHELIMALTIGLACSAATGLLAIIWYRFRFYRRKNQKELMLKYMLSGLLEPQTRSLVQMVKQNPQKSLEAFIELSQSLASKEPYLQKLLQLIKETKIHLFYIERLSSTNIYKRIEAAVYLGYLAGSETVEALENALSIETDPRAKLYICNSLTDIGSPTSIPILVQSLLGEENWYRTRVNMLIASYGIKFLEYVPTILDRTEIEIQSLLVDFSSTFPSEVMKRYLEEQVVSPNKDIAYRSARALGDLYPATVNDPKYYMNNDHVIRNITVQALAKIPEKSVIDLLIPLLADERSNESTVVTLSDIARKNPSYVEYLIDRFQAEQNPKLRDGMAKVLSNRIEYMLVKLLHDRSGTIKKLILNIVMLGRYNGIISFLNRNKNIELENEILKLLSPVVKISSILTEEFSIHLKSRMLNKLGLQPHKADLPLKTHNQPQGKKVFLVTLLIAAIIAFPVIYSILHFNELFAWTWTQHLTQYVLDMNYWVAYYALSINSIYFILLLLSFRAATTQMRMWNLKKNKFLFKPRILPGISIIAPVYREESTIIESVNSLLNLRYPNYELIVVNDGSPDETLNRLIQEFDLEKVDMVVPQRLNTMPILGIYTNKSIPNLIVIDKVNGGKADGLNAGINLSRKEFFCGIDADSLLESDSLLKLTSLTIDSPYEAVALGGNIFPINGCEVHRGMLERIAIPKTHLGRLQAIEYLRAFMAGRLGWAKLDCLLIISGAFGLFRKDRVLEVGGYLTSKERYQIDTVGEDMELVVRLERAMLESQKPFKVLYSYNSNCWTEVPESLRILYRQRDRWQRGLIDVIHFHRKMFLNTNYGRTGFLAVPYFIIFELLGPLIEFQGYLMVALAVVLGILNQEIAMLLFAASILYGIVISVSSLIILVEDTQYFSAKELFVLVLYALLENFAIRQIFSFWRITGFFSSLRSAQGWGSIPRKGFSITPKVSKSS